MFNVTGACAWLCRLPEEKAYSSTPAGHLFPGEEGEHSRPVGGLASYVRTIEGAFWDQGVWDRWRGTAPEAASGGNHRGEQRVTHDLFYMVVHLAELVLDNEMSGSRSCESHLLSLCNVLHVRHWCHKCSRCATLTCGNVLAHFFPVSF